MKTIKQITQFIIGLLLLLVALYTIKYTFLVGIATILIVNIYKKRFLKALAKIGSIFTSVAFCIDVLACVVLQVPLNLLFVKKGGYQFGNKRNTISYALGINQINNTLSTGGKKLVLILDFLQEDHCIKAVSKATNL